MSICSNTNENELQFINNKIISYNDNDIDTNSSVNSLNAGVSLMSIDNKNNKKDSSNNNNSIISSLPQLSNSAGFFDSDSFTNTKTNIVNSLTFNNTNTHQKCEEEIQELKNTIQVMEKKILEQEKLIETYQKQLLEVGINSKNVSTRQSLQASITFDDDQDNKTIPYSKRTRNCDGNKSNGTNVNTSQLRTRLRKRPYNKRIQNNKNKNNKQKFKRNNRDRSISNDITMHGNNRDSNNNNSNIVNINNSRPENAYQVCGQEYINKKTKQGGNFKPDNLKKKQCYYHDKSDYWSYFNIFKWNKAAKKLLKNNYVEINDNSISQLNIIVDKLINEFYLLGEQLSRDHETHSQNRKHKFSTIIDDSLNTGDRIRFNIQPLIEGTWTGEKQGKGFAIKCDLEVNKKNCTDISDEDDVCVITSRLRPANNRLYSKSCFDKLNNSDVVYVVYGVQAKYGEQKQLLNTREGIAIGPKILKKKYGVTTITVRVPKDKKKGDKWGVSRLIIKKFIKRDLLATNVFSILNVSKVSAQNQNSYFNILDKHLLNQKIIYKDLKNDIIYNKITYQKNKYISNISNPNVTQNVNITPNLKTEIPFNTMINNNYYPSNYMKHESSPIAINFASNNNNNNNNNSFGFDNYMKYGNSYNNSYLSTINNNIISNNNNNNNYYSNNCAIIPPQMQTYSNNNNNNNIDTSSNCGCCNSGCHSNSNSMNVNNCTCNITCIKSFNNENKLYNCNDSFYVNNVVNNNFNNNYRFSDYNPTQNDNSYRSNIHPSYSDYSSNIYTNSINTDNSSNYNSNTNNINNKHSNNINNNNSNNINSINNILNENDNFDTATIDNSNTLLMGSPFPPPTDVSVCFDERTTYSLNFDCGRVNGLNSSGDSFPNTLIENDVLMSDSNPNIMPHLSPSGF